MSDPFANDPEEGDLTLDPVLKPERARNYTPSQHPLSQDQSLISDPSLKSERVRTFTPGTDARPSPSTPFRRVVSRESGPEEDIEALEAEPAEPPPPGSWDTAEGVSNMARAGGQLLPALQRNKTYDFLNSVHHRTDPEAIENRIFKVFRLSAVALLGVIVILVLGAIFVFRPGRTPVVTPAANPTRTPADEEVIDVQAATAEAVATLDAFLGSTAAEQRQKLIAPGEPMPLLLAAPGRVPGLEKATFSPENARVVRLGREVAVLVPMVDHAGLSRTAALLRGDGQFRVDWRSVVTPEPMAWTEFVATPGDEPRLFRVELQPAEATNEPAATLSVRRPVGTPAAVSVTVDPKSRVGEELRAALETRKGKPLTADVYLEGKPGGLLRIVGWAPDKWGL
jgi:hypothetical protein